MLFASSLLALFMKSEKQIYGFLVTQKFKSKADYEMIVVFLSRHQCEIEINPKIDPESGIEATDFPKWFNDGFAPYDVVWYQGKLAMLGQCSLEIVQIVAFFDGDTMQEQKVGADVTQIKRASDEEAEHCRFVLCQHGLQFIFDSCIIAEKYIPKLADKIEFEGRNMRGAGIVRDIRPEDNYIELYCYYIFDTNEVGFSMHEKDICNVSDFSFSPMRVHTLRRLNKELAKYGKTWYGKLNRVEPLKMRVQIGERYWYINDKLKAIQEVEKGTSTSQLRYCVGNYFRDLNSCLEVIPQMAELFKNSLSDFKPQNDTKKSRGNTNIAQ